VDLDDLVANRPVECGEMVTVRAGAGTLGRIERGAGGFGAVE
jgi:hypothetical protein